MSRVFKVFISHSWDYVEDLTSLRNLLGKRGYFHVEFQEVPPTEPINSSNSNYVKKVLSDKIANSDVMLGLAGMYASRSDWMEWELDKANELGVPVVGVIPRGQERVSDIVRQRAKTSVRWNTESIVAAIRNYAN